MDSPNHKEAFIISAARTPVGRMGGALSSMSAAQLGAVVISESVKRAKLSGLQDIDEVYMGNVVSAGLGQNIARQCAIHGGIPATVGACTINKVCGASLKAVMLAAQAIRAGDGHLFVCGGVESMSQAPYLVDGRLGQLKFGQQTLRDSLVTDGLWCAFENWAMGKAAEFIAEKYQISRSEMDRYALQSHHKALKAISEGAFEEEIVQVVVYDRKGQMSHVSQDESPRRDTSIEALARLSPAFQEGGRVTAGNAPGLNDAAAAVVVASKEKVDQLKATPMARIAGYTQIAMEPKYIFATPAKAIEQLLDKLGWSLAEVDLLEVNEAFAAQILANGKALKDKGWDWEKVNIYGGAIALGHPLGATGARMLTTLSFALERRNLRRGIVTLCLGGGEAVAIALERS